MKFNQLKLTLVMLLVFLFTQEVFADTSIPIQRYLHRVYTMPYTQYIYDWNSYGISLVTHKPREHLLGEMPAGTKYLFADYQEEIYGTHIKVVIKSGKYSGREYNVYADDLIVDSIPLKRVAVYTQMTQGLFGKTWCERHYVSPFKAGNWPACDVARYGIIQG